MALEALFNVGQHEEDKGVRSFKICCSSCVGKPIEANQAVRSDTSDQSGWGPVVLASSSAITESAATPDFRWC